MFDLNTRKCVCRDGFVNIQGRCGMCNDDQVYNLRQLACVPRCSLTQHWINGKCQCLKGYNQVGDDCIFCNSY